MLGCWLTMVALVATLLWVLVTKRDRWEWVVKPAAAATFVVTGVVAGAAGTAHGRVLLAGLALAALGDVLLIPKSKRSFLLGLVAFLLGHVAYAVAFVVHGVDVTVALLGLVVMGAIAVPVLRWLWPRVERPMRAPVLAYLVVISSMVALGVATAWRSGAWAHFVGALAFYLSDLAVARERFVKREIVNRLWGLPLYFGAQMILAGAAGNPAP